VEEIRTLIVDDDADQRLIVRTLLKRAGIGPIAEVVDAEAALAHLEHEQPDLIVLDLAMPGRSGLEVLPDLAARAPGASIVVVSNFPRRRAGEAAIERGAVGYVEKRVAPERMVQEILMAAAIAGTATDHISTALPAAASSPRAARALVRDMLGEEETSLVETVELLVSELVTNAIVHASSAPRVEADFAREQVRVAVYDDDPTPPRLRDPDGERPGGRGLHLLDGLASRWGTEASGAGKVVWFELDRTRPG
jgi:DNA-binding NarL/FixJ family response regulator